MTPLPSLNGWDATRDALHTAAQTLSAVKRARIPQQPNALHLSLYVQRGRLTTRALSTGDVVTLRLATGEIHAEGPAGTLTLPVHGSTGAALLDALAAHFGLDRGALKIERDAQVELHMDPPLAADYARALDTIFEGFARFRAALLGGVTPLIVWPHNFDLSMLWFPGNVPDEASQPHLNFGFEPRSAGFPRPYLYAYARPMPDGFATRPLPAGARWNTDGWNGIVVDYDTLTGEPAPADAVETLLHGLYHALYP
jgi:hypothetical protein